MKLFKKVYFSVLLFLFILLIIPLHRSHASKLMIKDNGSVLWISDRLKEGESEGKQVLGSSASVTITVTTSQFTATNTPTPTHTPTPTITPTPTSGGSSPTNTPTPPQSSPTSTPTPKQSYPTNTPTPTNVPSGRLLATIAGNGITTTEEVGQVVIEGNQGEPDIVITSQGGGDISIAQGETAATTTLPIQVDTDEKELKAGTKEGYQQIISPEEAMAVLKKNGTFLIPDTIKLTIINEKGNVVYRMAGLVNLRILSLFNIKLSASTDIRATDGRVVEIHESLFLRILKFVRIGKPVITGQ